MNNPKNNTMNNPKQSQPTENQSITKSGFDFPALRNEMNLLRTRLILLKDHQRKLRDQENEISVIQKRINTSQSGNGIRVFLDDDTAKIYTNTKGQFVHENKVTGERFPITFDQFIKSI